MPPTKRDRSQHCHILIWPTATATKFSTVG